MSYKQWLPNEPNNAGRNEHCMQLRKENTGWNDVRCNNKFNFICKMSHFHGNMFYVSSVQKTFDAAESHCKEMTIEYDNENYYF